ncbi:unnamed protein product, partial [Allacma fusca]
STSRTVVAMEEAMLVMTLSPMRIGAKGTARGPVKATTTRAPVKMAPVATSKLFSTTLVIAMPLSSFQFLSKLSWKRSGVELRASTDCRVEMLLTS